MRQQPMFDNIIQDIRQVLSAHDTVIVGLSGGADSMALMSLLSEAKCVKIVAAHCNFHLRGEESDRDQAFVERVMDQRWAEHRLEVKDFDTVAYAKSKAISIEMAARALRYEWFEELKHKYNASLIVVGHHLNDQVETLLLNLIRGTGGVGLTGMDVLNGSIYRPLLDITREQILGYLRELGIDFITDSTNDDETYRRNLLRSKVVPLFADLNPNFYHTMSRSIDIFRAEQAVIEDQVQALEKEVYDSEADVLDLGKANGYPHARLLLFRILQKRGFSSAVIDDILPDVCRDSATFLSVDKSLKAELFRGKLFFAKSCAEVLEGLPPFLPYDAETPTFIGAFYWGREAKDGDFTLRFSLPRHSERLQLRYATHEDHFRPYGMKKGKKKVFTYLKEQGAPPMYRGQIPVLVYEGEIVAVVPFQIDDRFALTSGTETAYFLSFTPVSSPLFSLVKSLKR